MEEHFVCYISQERSCFGIETMVDTHAPHRRSLVNSFLRSIHINLATAHENIRGIVRLGRTFELCDIEARQFDWLLNLLRVLLMCLCE